MAHSNQILLRDRNGRPWGKVEAFIKWKSGTSKVWIPESGSADFNGSGEIEYIEVAGTKYNRYQTVSNDTTIVIQTRN